MFDELRAANERYAQSFELGGLAGQAVKGIAIVTCIDTRIEPLAVLGLRPGDAKILRNAGGRVTSDVLRSLVLATKLLGVTHVVVMHHTDCALAGRSEEQIRQAIGDPQTSTESPWEFLAMPDPDAALAADTDEIARCTRLPEGVAVEGWRYDVRTGRVKQMVEQRYVAQGS